MTNKKDTTTPETDTDTIELRDHGVIFLSGEITEETAEVVCTKILEINLQKKCTEIKLIINSEGGDLDSAFAIINVMKFSSLPIQTYALGLIASASLIVFMAGDNRVLTPTTSILSHRFWNSSEGSHGELVAARRGEDIMHDKIINHYIKYTKLQTAKSVERHLLKKVDTWLTPAEALDYKLADDLIDRFESA